MATPGMPLPTPPMGATLAAAQVLAQAAATPSTPPAPIQTAGKQGGPLDDTLAQVQSNTFFSVQQACDHMNAAAITEFMTQWNKWKSDYLQLAIGLDAMPVPPRAYVVGYFTDPTTGQGDAGFYSNTPVQWAFPSRTGGPVIAPPPVPALPKPAPAGAPTWFNAVGGTVKTAVLGDTYPVGAEVTDPTTGKVWVKKSSSTPFGTAYFYELKPGQ